MNVLSPSLVILTTGEDVAVAQSDIAEGESLCAKGINLVVRESISSGDKVAIRAVPAGNVIHKYGQVIGRATQDIRQGDHVHVHNLDMPEAGAFHESSHLYAPTSLVNKPITFAGFLRDDGRVGTRNFIGVISSVNCSATVCKQIADAFRGEALSEWPGVDGVVAITHGSGCGMWAKGDGFDILSRTLRGYSKSCEFRRNTFDRAGL